MELDHYAGKPALSDPGKNRTVVYCIDSSCAMYVSSWERLPCGTVEKDSGNTTNKLRKILFQAILIVGVVLGMSYTRFLDRIASVISMKDIYFYISGTGALAGTQVLENIAERFSILVTFHEPDLLIIPISFFSI